MRCILRMATSSWSQRLILATVSIAASPHLPILVTVSMEIKKSCKSDVVEQSGNSQGGNPVCFQWTSICLLTVEKVKKN